MTVSLFELFKVGIGPSSSHTVGPMVAARRFIDETLAEHELDSLASIYAEVFGSLALTGLGHGTDKAVVLGLSGYEPHSVDPNEADQVYSHVKEYSELTIFGKASIPFCLEKELKFHRRTRLPFHSNGMQFSAFDRDGKILNKAIYYSVGGGFVVSEQETENPGLSMTGGANTVPYDFSSAKELLEIARSADLSIAEVVLANEKALKIKDDIYDEINSLWKTMEACIDRGCAADGVLPGRLNVSRRAGKIHDTLIKRGERTLVEPMAVMDWVNLWAIAVNEENAAGGRVVTAPTNGAAGIIPAVLRYYDRFCHGANNTGITDFFLTATAIGSLYKRNASISGAEVGCQGEVGVACSMAAAGLTAALGGSNEQIENAAEIGMEHNLGLTCDPIGGLVQIPCIERNAIGAIKAIDASRMAMLGDGSHKVSLDKVIATMRQTGLDMQLKYKETSKGGLAVNIVEC